MQILVLILTRNYVLYLITQILFIFGENITKAYYSQKWYPFIKGKKGDLAKYKIIVLS